MNEADDKSSIIRMFHVHHNYGTQKALIDITLDIFKNDFVFITGPSGAGKTTLLKLFYLAEAVAEGQVLIDGINLSRIPRKRIPLLRRKFGIIFQDYKLIATRSVFDNVSLVLEAAGKKRRLIQKKVRSVLRLVGMEDRQTALPPSLSGGEQQRVAVARAIVGDPKIILADEPTGSLDEDSAGIIMDLLKRVHIRGATVIIATHDKDLIRKMGDWKNRRLLKRTMILLFFRRAIEDFHNNRLLNIVTLLTISLSILIVSAFILFFINTSEIMNFWKKGLRVMAYLKPDVSGKELSSLKQQIQAMDGVESLRFISKEEALKQLKAQMQRQASLFDDLDKNPLPDAFEIRISKANQSWKKVESLAAQIESLDAVEEVEYGQKWFGHFSELFKLFTLTGYAMCTIFVMAAVFIMANTIRLVIYSRRDEIEIMRLVGAAERFIKIPFYIQGLLQGALGAGIGLITLFVVFWLVVSNIKRGFFSGLFNIQFLSPEISGAIFFISILAGWMGSYISLKQHLKV